MKDVALKVALLKKLRELRLLIDAVGPTSLRHVLDQHATDMHNAIAEFIQED